MKKDTFGDRMKRYEGVAQTQLMRRTPVIIRLDGKAFHTFTRGLEKPFDDKLGQAMASTMLQLASQIQGCVFGYTQSDEIQLLLKDWDTFTTDAWFDYKVQKMVSVASSIATAHFNRVFQHPTKDNAIALFDARAFNVPMEEVVNCFLWRQQDATRNSINSLGQAHFSHKSLQGKNTSQVQDMLMLEKGINWNDIPTRFKRGTCVNATESGGPQLDFEIPVFSQDREYISRHLKASEE
jgi:tRNA(His) 5'-end guanylyltransferase